MSKLIVKIVSQACAYSTLLMDYRLVSRLNVQELIDQRAQLLDPHLFSCSPDLKSIFLKFASCFCWNNCCGMTDKVFCSGLNDKTVSNDAWKIVRFIGTASESGVEAHVTDAVSRIYAGVSYRN